MAAAGGGGDPVRLRLLFDYPPPGSPGCALCWLLLEPSQVRLVTDLISLIRDRFGFSRRAQLSLFLEGALLPPTESARLVRDNDSLRVKLEEIVVDDFDEVSNDIAYSSRKERKKHKQKLEEEADSKSEDDACKRKKKKKENSKLLSPEREDSVIVQDCQKKSKKRKRKEEVNGRNGITGGKGDSCPDASKKLKKKSKGEKDLEAEGKDAKQSKTKAVREKTVVEKTNTTFLLSPSKSSTIKNITAQSHQKKGRISDHDSSSTSSDSEMDTKQNKPSHKATAATLHGDKSQLAANFAIEAVVANKITTKSKDENSPKVPISKKGKPQSSSSDSDSSVEEEEEQQSSNLKRKLLPNNPPAGNIISKSPKAKSSSSECDSSDSETFVIKKPIANVGFNKSLERNGDKQLPASSQGLTASPSSLGRGLGRGEDNLSWRGHRGRGFRGMIRGRGRSRGRGRGESNSFFFNYSTDSQKEQQLSDSTTNTSVVIQNPVEVPKRDYSVLPLLAAPPQVGEKIAFKLLELTENYSPEVSDYKEGKIISWNADSNQIELEILSSAAVVKEPGKFDLVYQSEDGAEMIEYAVSQDTKITESWSALIEPRLIVEPSPTNETSTENVKL